MTTNTIDTTFTPLTYVDPFPSIEDDAAVKITCGRCAGSRIFRGFEHIDGGRCYECSGHGYHPSTAGKERSREKKRVQRRNAELRATARKQQAHNDRIAAAEATFPELAEWRDLIGEDNFLMDLWTKAFDRDLTEKQIAAAAATINRRKAWAAEKEAVAAARAELPPAPVGKVEVSGTVTSVKYKENDFGGAWKMVVEGEDGWKVWSTVPAPIINAAMAEQEARDSSNDEEFVGWSEFIVGRTITFTATLEPSRDDASFAFAKRPTKATLAK